MNENQVCLERYMVQVKQALDKYLNDAGCLDEQKTIVQAMRYSALAGGKRLRPVLTMAFCKAVGGVPEYALPFACALEMIHTYSLIHDDLPCMDDDDLRRGRPTSHKVYGEGMAVLTGDALLTYAFEVAAQGGQQLRPEQVVAAVRVLAQEAGYRGMIGGQVLDLAAEHEQLDYEHLVRLQSLKTGGLIRAAARMGCMIGNGSEQQIQAAQVYADRLGLAFQIEDDILDIEGDEAVFGKPIGSDMRSGKSTFPRLLGIEACKKMVRTLTDEAISAISIFPQPDFLIWLANGLVDRKK